MKVSSSVRFAAPLLLCMLALSHAQEQPSLGVPVPPLGAGPWVFDTAEQHKVRVSVVTKGLSHPWAIAFLTDGGMLVTERPGRLRIVREGVLESHAISGVPTVRTDGNGGLMDVALHPQFADNRLVYLTYTKPVGNGRGARALARGRLEAGALTDVRDLLVTEAYEGNSGLNGRVAFGRDGKLYMSTGGRVATVSQDPMSLRGKVLRLNDNGSVPDGQPVREPRRPSTGNLHLRTPQYAGSHPCTYGKPHTHGSRDRSRGRGAGERWQREHRGRALRERRRVAGVLRTFLRPPRGVHGLPAATVHGGRQAA